MKYNVLSKKYTSWASQVVLVVKNLPANAGGIRDRGSIPGLGRSDGEGNGNLLQHFLPGESHGQRNLAGYSPVGSQKCTSCSLLALEYFSLRFFFIILYKKLKSYCTQEYSWVILPDSTIIFVLMNPKYLFPVP